MRLFLLAGVALAFFQCSEQKNQEEKKPTTKSETQEIPEEKGRRVIMFFGNSLTAGYGIDPEQAFPAIIQDYLDSLGYDYQVVNAGLSGETTASGANRIEWVLRTIPDIFVLELGANDGLRGLALSETPKNLQKIIDQVKSANPSVKIIITGMEVPPNLGQDYTRQFREIFPRLARKNEAILVPFLLEGVAGESNLNLEDGIHPTPEGHKIVARTVWTYLEPLLEKEKRKL
jgi:acyl-CoA thioesterase-1